MSTLSDVVAGIRKVVVLDKNVAQLQIEIEALVHDSRRMRDYVDTIDRRLVRLETKIERASR
jgi:hypothetical protein